MESSLKSSFPAQLLTENNTGSYCDAMELLGFCILNSLSLQVLEAVVDSHQNAPHVHSPRCHLTPVLGSIIPAGLAFQNKGCMFSVCLSKEGCITAGLTDKQTESGEPRPDLATLSQKMSQNILFVQAQLELEGINGETRPFQPTTCAPYAFWNLMT